MTLPKRIRLMSQRIVIRELAGLRMPCEHEDGSADSGHGSPAYGLYDERDQTITLEAHLPFERQRETLMHECLHVMFKLGGLDDILTAEAEGLDEHCVAILAPLMLNFLRANPRAAAYLSESQA